MSEVMKTSDPALNLPDREGQGFNLVGHLTGRLGLGAAARMTLGLIEANCWPLSIVDVVSDGAKDRQPISSSAPGASIDSLPYSSTLLHMNPAQVVDGMLVWHPELLDRLATRHLTSVTYWELPVLPSYWCRFLRGMDSILAPSAYIQRTLAAALSGPGAPEIIHFPQAVQPPGDIVANRARWFGERAETTVFLSSFDAISDMERKNPWAAVEAFLAAFPDRRDVTLALKVGYHDAHPIVEKMFASLDRLSRQDARVRLIVGTLSNSEVWSLHASADVYVSLHRAEGLGLGMMESMALGVPVIATAWSGNMDFMTRGDSMLVPYELVPVSTELLKVYADLAAVAEWADADTAAAAESMRVLVEDPALRRDMGARALESSCERWLEYRRAKPLARVLDLSVSADLESTARRRRLRRLKRDVAARGITSGHASEQLRRQAVSLLRAARLKPPAPVDEVANGPLEIVEPTRSPGPARAGNEAGRSDEGA